jgi:hypothetical protein
MTTIMPDSYHLKLLVEGRKRKFEELADFASQDRADAKAKEFAKAAKAILQIIADLDMKIAEAEEEPVGGLDYRDDLEIHVAIRRFLAQIDRPMTQLDLTTELIRGKFPGYKLANFPIRVGRSIRSYTTGATASQNSKLRELKGRVGLAEWSDKKFNQRA